MGVMNRSYLPDLPRFPFDGRYETHKQQKPLPPKTGEKDQATSYFFPVNCSSSVDPFKAVVEDVPPVITIDT